MNKQEIYRVIIEALGPEFVGQYDELLVELDTEDYKHVVLLGDWENEKKKLLPYETEIISYVVLTDRTTDEGLNRQTLIYLYDNFISIEPHYLAKKTINPDLIADIIKTALRKKGIKSILKFVDSQRVRVEIPAGRWPIRMLRKFWWWLAGI